MSKKRGGRSSRNSSKLGYPAKNNSKKRIAATSFNEARKNNKDKKKIHPLFHQKLTLGQRAADKISQFGGSWTFIMLFFLFLFSWISINTLFLIKKPFDPFPYILLNLALSCLAAVQAPIILMAQNRQTERDRLEVKYDYGVNRKAEREIQDLQKGLNSLKTMLKMGQYRKV